MSTPRELLRRIGMLFHRRRSFNPIWTRIVRLHLELRQQEQVEAGCACG